MNVTELLEYVQRTNPDMDVENLIKELQISHVSTTCLLIISDNMAN